VKANDDFMSFGTTDAFQSSNGGSENADIDFERLVKGDAGVSVNAMDGVWGSNPANATGQPMPSNSTQPKPGMFSQTKCFEKNFIWKPFQTAPCSFSLSIY
jgi:SCY1-like protein 2